MSNPIKLAVSIATVTLGLAGAAPAQAECFLKLEGIKGESTDAKHPGEIAVIAWSWGFMQSAAAHVATGAGSGSADIGDLKITKTIDHATPFLAQFGASGTNVKSAVLSCRTPGKNLTDFLVLSLSGTVFVSSHKIGIDKDRPTEELSLSFAAMKLTHWFMKPDGTATEPATFTWPATKR